MGRQRAWVDSERKRAVYLRRLRLGPGDEGYAALCASDQNLLHEFSEALDVYREALGDYFADFVSQAWESWPFRVT
ncbi:hypothetical protein N7493_007668 [Penicillium malachiteum]|uniref:Uncharacterized protein n=1 Tax=Penicillium malachiteum TaxID=1324776 RepID=A0AAD6MU64_9EURO|nr:hypothetical protein N7493_007668 [Penicillium malachiteum]